MEKKFSNVTKLTFARAVEIAANVTIVKELARQFHSPGSTTVCASSSEIVYRVRFAPKQSERKYPRHVSRYEKS